MDLSLSEQFRGKTGSDFRDDPSYHMSWEHSLKPDYDYLVGSTSAKLVAVGWSLVLSNYLYVLASSPEHFQAEPIHFSENVNSEIVRELARNKDAFRASAVISFVGSMVYFFCLSFWVLLLEDFSNAGVFSASFIQVLGPMTVLLFVASQILLLVLSTIEPEPSDSTTLVWYIHVFLFQLSFAFFGILCCAVGVGIVRLRAHFHSQPKRYGNMIISTVLVLQIIFSVAFPAVFLKNGLFRLPKVLASVLWYGATVCTGIVAFGEVCWLTQYDPNVVQFILHKFNEISETSI